MIGSSGIRVIIDRRKLMEFGAQAMAPVIKAVGTILEADVKRMLTVPGTFGPRSGNEYPRQQGKKIHVASAKGEPPAVDTGTLRRSVVSVVETSPSGRFVRIGPSALVEYAEDLEYGRPPKLAPRPYLRPVIMRYENTDDLLRRAISHLGGLRGSA